jgi:hypothetical protein
MSCHKKFSSFENDVMSRRNGSGHDFKMHRIKRSLLCQKCKIVYSLLLIINYLYFIVINLKFLIFVSEYIEWLVTSDDTIELDVNIESTSTNELMMLIIASHRCNTKHDLLNDHLITYINTYLHGDLFE